MKATIFNGVKVILQWLQQNPILTFIAGAMLSIGIELLFTGVLQRNISILVITISILVLFTITSINRTSESVVSLLKSPPFVGFTAYSEDQVAEAFTKAIEALRQSTNGIIALGGAVPKPEDPVQPRMPKTRSKYLHAIEETIIERLSDPGTTYYKYKRIVQSFSLPLTDTLRRDQVDPDMFEHCREIFRILSESPASSKINFELVIREPAYSCPSIVVIDDNYVSLSIIGERREFEAGRSIKVASMQGVVEINDRSGRAADHYIHVVDDLADGGIQIRGVEN